MSRGEIGLEATDFCEHGYESLGCIKIEVLNDLLALWRNFCDCHEIVWRVASIMPFRRPNTNPGTQNLRRPVPAMFQVVDLWGQHTWGRTQSSTAELFLRQMKCACGLMSRSCKAFPPSCYNGLQRTRLNMAKLRIHCRVSYTRLELVPRRTGLHEILHAVLFR